jgi:hypothetical protein
MTHEDRGHYAKKHPPDRKMDTKVAEAVKQQASNGEISCVAAHKISSNFNISPSEVGVAADFLEIRIVKCQLGLYGYRPKKGIVKPAETVSQTLKEVINQSLINGRLPCRAVWDIAERLTMEKMEVSSACETLKTKISSCQLGAF